MSRWVPLIARILIATIFLGAGFDKVMHPAGAEEYMSAHGMPLTGLAWAAAIAVELGGGVALVLGFRVRWAAVVLSAFVLVATSIFHSHVADPVEQHLFVRDLAIVGGLLMIACFGAGSLSLDAVL